MLSAPCAPQDLPLPAPGARGEGQGRRSQGLGSPVPHGVPAPCEWRPRTRGSGGRCARRCRRQGPPWAWAAGSIFPRTKPSCISSSKLPTVRLTEWGGKAVRPAGRGGPAPPHAGPPGPSFTPVTPGPQLSNLAERRAWLGSALQRQVPWVRSRPIQSLEAGPGDMRGCKHTPGVPAAGGAGPHMGAGGP